MVVVVVVVGGPVRVTAPAPAVAPSSGGGW